MDKEKIFKDRLAKEIKFRETHRIWDDRLDLYKEIDKDISKYGKTPIGVLWYIIGNKHLELLKRFTEYKKEH